jgi:hypothetical protein
MNRCNKQYVEKENVKEENEEEANNPIIEGNIHYVLLLYLHWEFKILLCGMLKVEAS